MQTIEEEKFTGSVIDDENNIFSLKTVQKAQRPSLKKTKTKAFGNRAPLSIPIPRTTTVAAIANEQLTKVLQVSNTDKAEKEPKSPSVQLPNRIEILIVDDNIFNLSTL
jgi:hypothetical protein